MDNLVKTESLGRRHRRSYEPSFKADVVAACQQPGVSVAAVALSHGLNANLLRRWVTEHERFGYHELEHEVPAPSVRLVVGVSRSKATRVAVHAVFTMRVGPSVSPIRR